MESEITESAKAVQEVAKTTGAGIEATEKLGGFVSKVINEPLETVVGILSDRLRFMRAERQLRLFDRWSEILHAKNIKEPLRIVSPKLVLPIVENASLEENNELQDLWANLLASAVDPDFRGSVRSAFIDIIKQLEVVDVHILKSIYDSYAKWNQSRIEVLGTNDQSPTVYSVHLSEITSSLPDLDERVHENSIDNLIRVRCIEFFIEDKQILTNDDPYMPKYEDVTFHHYRQVSMTALGVAFVEACLMD